MSSNEKLIIARYSDPSKEDARALWSRAYEIEFLYTKKFLSQYINKQTKVVEIGCATGYYGMYFADKCKSYLGVDLSSEQINLFKSKIESEKLKNVSAMVGDATNLNNIEDESFDTVLVLGPMYHLPADERESVFAESKRICKQNGVIIYAYINKAGAYMKGCLMWPEVYPCEKCNEFLLKMGTDDIKPDIFFFTMPEEIEKRAEENGLKVIKNVGVNFVYDENMVNNMSEEKFKEWLELCDFMCEFPSCTGLSIHTLLICKK